MTVDILERIKRELNPRGAYLMEEGPFGSNTILLVMDEDGIGRVEEFLNSLEEDVDIAVVTPDEYERIKESVERSGKRLW